jgi:hypothetical protein
MGDTVELGAPVNMVFTWYFMVNSMGFNLVLEVVVGCFLVSF